MAVYLGLLRLAYEPEAERSVFRRLHSKRSEQEDEPAVPTET